LTVALDFPKNAGQVHVFQQALDAEFLNAKEKIFRGPIIGLGITCYSHVLVGNREIPKVWRRLLRHLQYGRIIAPTADVWCYGARVYEISEHEPARIELYVEEG
jgi:hypothetical protein